VFDGYSLDLTDRTLQRHEACRTIVSELRTMAELTAVVREQLGMARCEVERAVAVLERHTERPFF